MKSIRVEKSIKELFQFQNCVYLLQQTHHAFIDLLSLEHLLSSPLEDSTRESVKDRSTFQQQSFPHMLETTIQNDFFPSY